MKKTRRIGILGGTFNPPHIGHLVLAQEALQKLRLNKLLFVPALIPPHKKIKSGSARLRYKMASLACEGNPGFEVSKIELKRKSISYSVNTLRLFKKKFHKNTDFFFITGSDSLDELESWKDIDEVLNLAHFVVGIRPGFPVRPLERKVKLLKIPALDISSSMIRNRVHRGVSIRYMLPEGVRRFIERSGLYK